MADTDKTTAKTQAPPKPKVKDLPAKDITHVKGGRVLEI
jgi:hypothetical protein